MINGRTSSRMLWRTNIETSTVTSMANVTIALRSACNHGTPELRHRQFLPTINTRVSSGDVITVRHRKEQRTFQFTDVQALLAR
jgi:hypothetical protein